jgi:hypothetical protein
MQNMNFPMMKSSQCLFEFIIGAGAGDSTENIVEDNQYLPISTVAKEAVTEVEEEVHHYQRRYDLHKMSSVVAIDENHTIIQEVDDETLEKIENEKEYEQENDDDGEEAEKEEATEKEDEVCRRSRSSRR